MLIYENVLVTERYEAAIAQMADGMPALALETLETAEHELPPS